MDIGTYEKAQEILKLVETTKTAITGINLIELRDTDNSHVKTGYDGLYNLCISKERDGSGGGSTLNRYRGNAELLQIIKDTLARQLKEFQEEFDNL